MTTRVKRGGVRTARARRRRITEATYEEPEGPSVPVPEPKGKRAATTARKAGANVGAEVEKHLDNFVETFTTLGVEGLRKQFKEELAAYRAPDDKYKFTAYTELCDEMAIFQCIEDGKIKGTQYWPLDAGQYQTYGKMFVNTKKVESEGKFLIYTVEVLPEGCSNSNIVKVLHMTSWPDRGLPMSGRHVLRLIRQVSGDRLDNGPIVMHCSAGIGRTGTIILIDIILRKLFSCQEVNLVELFKTLRNQRASCIQLEGQYVFIILSVLDYIKIKCPKYKEKVNKYMEDFRTALIPST
ncbi:Protein-tyrosine phosphatase [Ancylostoma caninum]|uniref:Protein-tyrosine phosphatase n=1 Tax=Ancylostoma caninum TaxID=29170 RepID=A0A368G0G4_ANCCA|nr:Protein-tyrosine phosphatase [Ancylostoma caninum]